MMIFLRQNTVSYELVDGFPIVNTLVSRYILIVIHSFHGNSHIITYPGGNGPIRSDIFTITLHHLVKKEEKKKSAAVACLAVIPSFRGNYQLCI